MPNDNPYDDAWETFEPDPDYWDDIPDHIRDDILERMDELGLNELFSNYDEVATQIREGTITVEYSAIFDFFLDPANRARLTEALGVWPEFEQLLNDYSTFRLDEINEIEDELADNPNAWQENLMAAFGEGFEPAFGFLTTQARLTKIMNDSLRDDTPPEPALPWELRIGASRFSVPPININVSQSFRVGSLSGGALRQQSAPKFNSGHKETMINMTLYFPNHESIWGIDSQNGELTINFDKGGDEDAVIDRFLSSLRGLITQFKYAPFLPIRNEYLNSTYGITGVVLHSMSIATVEDFPFVIAVNLQMLNFNHKVYLPMIEDFHQAIHWGRYRQYMGRAAQKINAVTSMGFLKETKRELELAGLEVPGQTYTVIEYESEPDNIFKSPYKEFRDKGQWNDGRHLDIYFPIRTPARIFAPDMANFRQPGEDRTGSDRDKNSWEVFLGYLGLDIDTNPDAYYDQVTNYAQEISANPTERQKLLEYLNWIGNVADTMNAEALEDYLEERFADEREALGVSELPQAVEDEIERQVRVAWFNYIFEGYKDTPFFQSYLANADYNSGHVTIAEWEVPMEQFHIDRNNVIVNGVSVSMANNIARLQIQMQDEPTHQHIGGRDTRVDVSLTVFGEDDLARFQRLFKHVGGLAQLEHAHGVLGFLGIKNAITTLAGIKYVLPLSFESDTIPGFPHVYNVRLSFVDFDVFQQKREELSTSQQEELVKAFGKRNPFLRIKQLWGAFNAYPDFPLSVRDGKGDLVGHLDPDYFYRAYQMIDDDVVNWDLQESVTTSQQIGNLPNGSSSSGRTNLTPAEQQQFNIDENGEPIPPPESQPTDAEGTYWTSGNNYPSGYPVDYPATGGRLDESLRNRNYVHGVNHYLGLFNEAQDEASIVRIESDGLMLGSQYLGDSETERTRSVNWLTNGGIAPSEEGGDPLKYNLYEDVAAAVHGADSESSAFVPLNTPTGAYMQPHADESANPYKQFELMMRDAQYRDISGRMIRAFPTYMLWLIDEGGNFAGVKLFDNFYGLQSVIDMSIHRSEDILGDTLTLRLSNLYQKLTTNYKGYISDGDPNTQIIDMFMDRNRNIASGTTDQMVALETIRLKPGVRVHLRMGYSANPNSLETVFNGTITQVTQGDIVEVIAQSDAIELSPYINTTNKGGHSGKLDGAFNTGLWLSEPRDLMVRLLSMGSSTFKEATAFATQGMIFSENRFGIRHFGSILYPPLTEEEDQKNRNIREVVGGLLSDAGSMSNAGDAVDLVAENTVESVAVGGEPDAFDASLGGIGLRSPVVGVMRQMWDNMFAQRDFELFKRNIYPGNGLGVAQYLGGDLLDGGMIWAEGASGAEPNAAEVAALPTNGPSGPVQDMIDAQAITDAQTGSDGEESGSDDGLNALDVAFTATSVSLGGPAGTLMNMWDNPVNPFSISGLVARGNIAQSLFGQGPYKNHPLLQMFGMAGWDEDLTGFDEVSFRAQTYMKSVWDLFQLCAALLPNYIVAVRPFEDRSTVFYGKPHWLYTSGVVPVTTGIPKPDELETDSVIGELVDLQREAANAANPLADLEAQLKFFKGLGDRVDPTNSSAGLEFDGDGDDVRELPLDHANGARIPYRSGPIVMEQHLPTVPGSAHKELPDLNPDYKYSNGYHSLNGSSGCGSFGCLEPEMEQFYMNMRWPYHDWSTPSPGQTPNPNDQYIPGQDPMIYKDRKIMVYAVKTGLACICTPGDAGPGANREVVAGLSPDTVHVLGIQNDDTCIFGFVDDGTPVGPVTSMRITDNVSDTTGNENSGIPIGDLEVDTDVDVTVVDLSQLDNLTYVDPISDRDENDKSFWFSLVNKDERGTATVFEGKALNREREIYAAANNSRDEDTLEDHLRGYQEGDERLVAFRYGWLIDEIPVWIDPQSGGELAGSVVVDQTGITARRIYDPEYNALFEDEMSGQSLILFEDQGSGRSVEEAEEIWDTIRAEFWTQDWVLKDFEEVWQEKNGDLNYEDRDFFLAMEEWIQYLWQDPSARAWTVLVMDRQGDWTSFEGSGIPFAAIDELGGVDVDDPTRDGIDWGDLNPGSWFHSAGNEGWNMDSNPFRDAWKQYCGVMSLDQEELTWRDTMWNWMVENFEVGSDAQTLDQMIGDAAQGLYDATVGKLVTAAALTMTGLVALFRLGLQQLGQGLDMLSDMQRQANILNRVFNDSIYYAAGQPGSILRLCDNPFTREYGEPVVEIREPFQRMHYISSFQHIISNNIEETLNDVATVVTASSDGKYPVTVYFDKGAPSERQVEKAVETGLFWDNARGSGFFGFLHPLFHPIEAARGHIKSATGSSDELLSKRVGLWHLKEGLKDIYGGELMVLGNPDIRPHDLVYLADVYERMYGMFEVEAVTHHFTPETGFITGIVPNAVVTINDPARWSVISWAWSWWAVKNTRDDLRQIMNVKVDASSTISDEGVHLPELADTLNTQLRGQVQYTHGGSSLVRDLMASRGSGLMMSTNEAITAVEGQAETGNRIGTLAGAFNPLGVGLLWPAWDWVKNNLLDQHGCYIQYLNKDGQPMDAGLSYAQGVAVGRHHSTNLLPGILGLEVDNFGEDGHRRITTNDLLASLGWSEIEVLEIQRDISWWVNRTNARILEISGDGPDPIGLGDSANIEMVTVDRIIDGDTFSTTDNRRIRLSGVNTDELQFKYNLDANAETDRAFLARQHLENILLDEAASIGHPATVAIRINPTDPKDDYDRTLAVVFHRVPLGTSFENRERVLLAQAGKKTDGLPRQPFITWDQFMPDGRPYTANWDLVCAGLANVDLGGITRNDPDRGAHPRGKN